MHIGGPILLIIVILVVQEAEGGGVVKQRVHPDIDHMTRVKIDGNAPLEARARDAEILQTGVDEVIDHLIYAAARLQKVGVRQQVAHGLRVFGQTEEVCLLLGGLALSAAVRAFAVLELALRPEGFAGGAVHAGIFALVDIALLIHLLKDLLDRFDMVVIRRADKAVVGDVHQLPQVEHALLARDDIVHELLRGDAGSLGARLDLLPVLVRAGQEHDIVAAQTLIARHRVGRYGAVGVPDVQLIRGVVDRGGDIKFRFTGIAHKKSLFSRICRYYITQTEKVQRFAGFFGAADGKKRTMAGGMPIKRIVVLMLLRLRFAMT